MKLGGSSATMSDPDSIDTDDVERRVIPEVVRSGATPCPSGDGTRGAPLPALTLRTLLCELLRLRDSTRLSQYSRCQPNSSVLTCL